MQGIQPLADTAYRKTLLSPGSSGIDRTKSIPESMQSTSYYALRYLHMIVEIYLHAHSLSLSILCLFLLGLCTYNLNTRGALMT